MVLILFPQRTFIYLLLLQKLYTGQLCFLDNFYSGGLCVSDSVVSDSWDPVDCSPPGSFVHGILQVRVLESVAIPFSRGSSWLRDRTQDSYISCVGRWIYHCTTWEVMQEVHHCVLVLCSSLLVFFSHHLTSKLALKHFL